MANSVELTKPHREALKREAHNGMEGAIGERNAGRRPEYVDLEEHEKQTKKLLACADVLAGLQFGERIPARGEGAPIEALFTDAAIDWMATTKTQSEEQLEELDRTGEGTYDYNCQEAFLIHTLDHVLSNVEGAQS